MSRRRKSEVLRVQNRVAISPSNVCKISKKQIAKKIAPKSRCQDENIMVLPSKLKKQKCEKNVNKKKKIITDENISNSIEPDEYEFFSQTSLSDSNNQVDEAIKKLVKTGKAVFSRQTTKPKKKPIKNRANWGNVLKNLNVNKNDIILKQNSNAISKTNIPKRTHQEKNIFSNEPQNNFLNLDVEHKSVFKTPIRKMAKDKATLLEIAQNIVNESTPNMRKKAETTFDNTLSPINVSSPWRFDEKSIRNPSFSASAIDLPYFSNTLNENDIKKTPNKKHNSSNFGLQSNIETVPKRNPLKEIKILSTIILPNKAKILPQKSPLKTIESAEPNFYNIENSIHNDISTLFGFEDSDSDNNSPPLNKILPGKDSLKKRLKSLEKLLPKKSSHIEYDTIKPIFNEPSKQAKIKEMLNPTKRNLDINISNQKNENIFNNKNSSDSGPDIVENNEELLFGDSPQIHIDKESIQRTYKCSPNKFKRRFKGFSNDSNKLNKRKKQNNQEDEELEKFAQEFNSMCDKVKEYQFVIETEKKYEAKV